MDSITQAALGAAIGEATLGRKLGGKGAIVGATIATLPDLDVILSPFYGQFERISLHRGFSHSIMFTVIAATVLAMLMKKSKWTKEVSMRRL